MRLDRFGSWRLAAIVPLLGLFLGGCGPGGEIDPPNGPSPRDDDRPRPVSVLIGSDTVRIFPCDSASASTKPREMLVLAGDSTQANEVHDCQKLVIAGELPGGGVYPARFGPLVGIYPLRAVDGPETTFASFRVVATLFNWGPGTYAPLGIGREWNCLWLRRDAGTGRWTARISRPTAVGCASAERDPPSPATVAFSVERVTRSDTATYRPTARWGWDEARGQHYIGIKCGTGWCFIGPPGFIPADSTLAAARGGEIPGLSDDQHLAIPASGGRLIPGPWGRITPARGLSDLDADALGSTLVPVANVILNGRPEQLAHYRDRWGFSRGLNRLYLSRGRDGIWIMTIAPTDGPRVRFEVDRYPAVMHAVDGAVRWRWDSRDESGWIGCDEACCTPNSSKRLVP